MIVESHRQRDVLGILTGEYGVEPIGYLSSVGPNCCDDDDGIRQRDGGRCRGNEARKDATVSA